MVKGSGALLTGSTKVFVIDDNVVRVIKGGRDFSRDIYLPSSSLMLSE